MDESHQNHAIETFFAQLRARGHEGLLERATGTIRFDVTDANRQWVVDIDHGDVRVSHRRTAGDAVVHVNSETLERMVTGQSNAMAGMLRGAFTAEGDFGLIVLFQRLFPGPTPVGTVARTEAHQ